MPANYNYEFTKAMQEYEHANTLEEKLQALKLMKQTAPTHKGAEKLRLAVSENEIDIYANTTMKKTISIGLAIFPKDSSSLNTILKYADIALYEAKESGRNKVVVYEDKQNKNVEIF